MDVHQKLDEIVTAVEKAKSMPMSASCVVNRSDLLRRLDEVRDALPGSLAQAQEVLGDRQQVVSEAQAEARRIVEAAHAERRSLIEGTEIVQQAQNEAQRLLGQARQEAEEVRAEADDYVDSKLANFEVVLGKTIASVDRGRDKLLGRDMDPERLLAEADHYVEAQFAAIEAVLSKTLEAVGRGRQKLTGHRPIDELHDQFNDADSPEAFAAAQYGQQQDDSYYGAPVSAGHGAAGQPADTGGYPGPDYGGGHSYPGYQEPSQPAAAGYPPTPGHSPYQQPAAAGYGEPAPYGYQQPVQPPRPDQYPAAGTLEETSLFDTGMIDAEQLRRYEQGR